jgi:hypothetical protein
VGQTHTEERHVQNAWEKIQQEAAKLSGVAGRAAS